MTTQEPTQQQHALTYEQKVELYRAGRYRFKAPSVCHALWDEQAWISFIDAYHGWIV